MKIKILTEGGKSIGLGHLSRCSSLYEELRSREISVEFVISGDIESIKFLKDYSIINTDWLNNDYLSDNLSKEDYVIVDSYQATREDYLEIKIKSHQLFVIDDFGRLDYPESMIVNPSLNVDNIDYSFANKNNLFLGPKYVIVRSAFVKDDIKIIQDDIKNVLIMMGGTDVRNLTSVLVEHLVKKYHAINFDIVINNQDFKNINHSKDLKNIRLHSNITDIEMSQLMKNSDFAITAAGQSIYELMATQTPFLAIQVIDNQRNNIEAIKRFISSEAVFQYDEKNFLVKLEATFDKFRDSSIRKEIVQKQRQLIDGKGTERIIDVLLKRSNINNMHLRDATLNDIEEVFSLSNEDYVRKYSINKAKISWNDHIKWYEETIKDNEVIFYIVTNENDEFIGQIRYNVESFNATVSISLSKKIRGKGLASYILEGSIKKLFDENISINSITAFVSEKNIASKKIFEDLNFDRIASKNDLLEYRLRRN